MLMTKVEQLSYRIERNRSVKITAIAEGDAELTVSDNETGKSKTIEVLVASNLTFNTPSYISAKEDEILNIEILSGSGDYSVLVADETVVMANISEGVLTINTLLEGTTTVTVTDNQTLKNAEITIVVEEYMPQFLSQHQQRGIIKLHSVQQKRIKLMCGLI